MARPPVKPSSPQVLSARSLLAHRKSLRPIIASRDGPSSSKEPDESTHLSHVHYVNDDDRNGGLSTPRNMYDDEETSTVIPINNNSHYNNHYYSNYSHYTNNNRHHSHHNNRHTTTTDINSNHLHHHHQQQQQHHRTRTHSLGGDSSSILYSHDRRRDSAVAPYDHNNDNKRLQDPYGKTVPILYDPGYSGQSHHHRHHPHHQQQRQRRQRRRRREKVLLAPPFCYIFLKILELLVCLAIMVLSRLWEDDVEQDFLFTALGTVGLLVAGLGLLLVWVKGHPVPGDCLHTTMLICYAITMPVLLTGALMLFIRSGNMSVFILAGLFVLGAALFTIDVVVMVTALLQCPCCCQYAPHTRSSRTYPTSRRLHHDNDSGFQSRHTYPHRHHLRHSHRNGYPRSVPQMNIR